MTTPHKTGSSKTSCVEWLIYDPTVQDVHVLLGGLNPGVRAVAVSATEDPHRVIAAALADPQLKRLHLLGHGAPGEIMFGHSRITAQSWSDQMGKRHLEIAATQSPRQINFWSCKTGEGETGMNLIKTVANNTGAIINASSGLVGHASAGGSWDLDINARPSAPFSTTALDGFEGVLELSIALSGDNGDLYLNALEATSQIEITFPGLLAGETVSSVSVNGSSITADASGKYFFEATTISGATVDILAQVTDGTQPRVLSRSVTVDTSLPPAFTQDSVLLEDTGVADDGITSDNTIEVTVPQLGADEKWQYTNDGGATWVDGPVPVNSKAVITLSEDVYAAGTLGIRTIDAAGNASPLMYPDPLTVDRTPPASFQAGDVALRLDSGLSGDGITNDGQVKVTLPTGAVRWAYSTNDGKNWQVGGEKTSGGLTNQSFTLSPDRTYKPGDVQVRAFDAAGNKSEVEMGSITVDQVDPYFGGLRVSVNEGDLQIRIFAAGLPQEGIKIFNGMSGQPFDVTNEFTIVSNIDGTFTATPNRSDYSYEHLHFQLSDLAGNSVSSSGFISVSSDALQPLEQAGAIDNIYVARLTIKDTAQNLADEASSVSHVTLEGVLQFDGSMPFGVVRELVGLVERVKVYNNQTGEKIFDASGEQSQFIFTVAEAENNWWANTGLLSVYDNVLEQEELISSNGESLISGHWAWVEAITDTGAMVLMSANPIDDGNQGYRA